MNENYDVIVIGAGAVGCAVARELSRYDLRIAVLEKNSDIAGETTGRNSAVVHAGFNNRSGSRMASLCVEGNQGFEALCRDLDVPFRQTGKLVVAFDEEDEQRLEQLLFQGRENGCRDLEILKGERLEKLLREKNMRWLLGPSRAAAETLPETKPLRIAADAGPDQMRRCQAALWSPHTGITNPFLYCVALAENAHANGAEFFLDTEVTGISKQDFGFEVRCERGGGETMRIHREDPSLDISSVRGNGAVTVTRSPEPGHGSRWAHGTGGMTVTFCCRYLINCAGLQADRIAAMAGVDAYQIYPCRGEYFILDKMDGSNKTEANGQANETKANGQAREAGANGQAYETEVNGQVDEAGQVSDAVFSGLSMPVYPAPRKNAGGLGVHLTPTIEGNIIIGPSADYLDPSVRDDYACTRPVMQDLMEQARQLIGIEQCGDGEVRLQPIGNYSGIRPKLAPPDEGGYHDFVIQAEEDVPGLINLVGIESPGLTASVPIAKQVCRMIGKMECTKESGCGDQRIIPDGHVLDEHVPKEHSMKEYVPGLRPNPDFIGTRRGILRFREQSPERQAELIAEDPDYGEIICRCQKITKREIREAIENPLGAVSISSIKYRAWATTGRCNGGYCLPRIVQLLLEEYGWKPEEIRHRDQGSEMFIGMVK